MRNIEYLNRAELVGVVGLVKIQNIGDIAVAHFSLATNYGYANKFDRPVEETTWHNVTAWESDSVSFNGLVKGAVVHVVGRIRHKKYTTQDGNERYVMEILAGNLEVIPDEDSVND